MSRENPTGPEVDTPGVAAIRGALEAFSAGGRGLAGLDLFDPEIEIQDYVGFIDAEWHLGHEGVLKWVGKIRQAVGEKVRVTPVDFIEAPDGRLAFSYEIESTGKRSGVEIPVQHGHAVAAFRAGKILRVATYVTRAEALEAVGLAE
jgi:hypothetical protein